MINQNNKKFYWIKLKTDFFNQEAIDFLMSQENGCQYIVLYQMLCLQTANNNGQMATQIGEVLVPYDVKKIMRDTKYFDVDTVTVALELFKRLGLVYQEDDNILRIANVEYMVGSESATKEAIKKREYRARKSIEDIKGDKKGTNCPTEIEYRDKSIEIRDRDRDKDKDKDKTNPVRRFSIPTLLEVKDYCKERNNNINPEQFIDYYMANGWKVGKSPMKDWKAAIRTWERNENPKRETQMGVNGVRLLPENEQDHDLDYIF